MTQADLDLPFELDPPKAEDLSPPLDSKKTKPPSKPKEKKRTTSFEIIRTLLTRTHERKLAYCLKRMGEDSDIIFLSSAAETDFIYGSPDLSVGLFDVTDDDLKAEFQPTLDLLYGFNDPEMLPCVLNFREQFSTLAKSKGERFPEEDEVYSDGLGSTWTSKTDAKGTVRTTYYSQAVVSLFQMAQIKDWCQIYRPLLSTDDPDILVYPYTHPPGPTAEIITLPPASGHNHPSRTLFPNGFRIRAIRGLDVLIDKGLDKLPYPLLREEILVVPVGPGSVYTAHRLIGQGWRMIIVRPFAVLFSLPTTFIPITGSHSL